MRVRDTPERRDRMQRYCEARREELIDMGASPEDLVEMRAGQLSELVITARQGGGARRAAVIASVQHHPSSRRSR